MEPFPVLDLHPDQLEEIQRILKTQIPQLMVWAFGSRVDGTARTYSDLDIVLMTQTPLSLADKADLVAAFEESDLPFKVDISDWSTTSESFQKVIAAKKVVLQAAAEVGTR